MAPRNDEVGRPERSCPFQMLHYKLCGREIHPAPLYDETPVCLMHSKDPAKANADFEAEITRILATASHDATLADFSGFVFLKSDYLGRIFTPACWFRGSIFNQSAEFGKSTFVKKVDFAFCTFERGANFSKCKFLEEANFGEAAFSQVSFFYRSTFSQKAQFHFAQFTQDALFYGSKFASIVDLEGASFSSHANFSGTKLLGQGTFRATHFRHDSTNDPSLDFSEVEIEHPELVEFYKTDLNQALFYNTDISKVNFTLVTWRTRKGTKRVSGRKLSEWIAGRQSHRFCIFDEEVDLKWNSAMRAAEGSADERNYGLLAETYQQLKRNYDAKGDYWTAGHWHYGEMEMKRLHSPWHFRPFRWLSHHFSLVALYKYASAYGESYMMPIAWLGGVLALFTLAYPVSGLELNQPGSPLLSYRNFAEFFRTHPAEHPSGCSGMLLHSFLTSVSVAGFQRELRYVPSYPWGRLLALIEMLLTATLGALFLLALRRQFRRS